MRKFLNSIVLVLALFVLSVPALAAEHLRFATASAGGLWYVIGGTMTDIFKKQGIQASITSGNGISNLATIQDGRTDLAFTMLYPSLLTSTTPLIGKDFSKVRLIAHMYPQYLYFVARKDWAEKNNVKTVGDLFTQKLPFRYATLARGTIAEYLARQVFDIYNTTVEEIVKRGGKVEYGSYDQGADLMVDNHVDLYIVAAGLPLSTLIDIETRLPIVLLPVDKATAEALAQKYGTTLYHIKKGSYKAAPEDIPAIGCLTSMICSDALSEDVVFTITKLLFEHQQDLAIAVKAMEDMNLKDAVVDMAFPFHPGALKYYKSLNAK